MSYDARAALWIRRLFLDTKTGTLGLAAIIAAVWIVMAGVSANFFSSLNFFAIGRGLSVDILVGFAQMATLATGGINLSIGSIGVCAAMFDGYLMRTLGLPVPVASLAALALGAALGGLNGLAITRSGVSSFAITLASSNLFSGAMLILTKARTFDELPPSVSEFGRLKLLTFVSPLLLITLAVGGALSLLYHRTVLGRHMLVTGGHPCAARLSGVPVASVVTMSHALSGTLASLAGLVVVARFGAAFPAIGGENWLLPSFIGPVLGGVPLAGGSVSVLGTILGELLVSTIRQGSLLFQISNFWLQFYLGAVLLFAVLLDRYRRTLVERNRKSLS